MPFYGGASPYPRRYGGGEGNSSRPLLQVVYQALARSLGSAYDQSWPPTTIVGIETMAIARALVFDGYGANQRLANSFLPQKMTAATGMLQRWERIFNVPPNPGDTEFVRRLRVQAAWARLGVSNALQPMTDALVAALGQAPPLSSFTPFSLSNLALWLRADNGLVPSQWNDLSANANNMLQGTGGNQPSVNSSNPHTNNKASATFAATQFMSAVSSASLQIPANGPITIAVVLYDTTVGLSTIASKGSAGEYDAYFNPGATGVKIGRAGTVCCESNITATTLNTLMCIVYTSDGTTTQSVYVNGVSQSLITNAFVGSAGLTANAVQIGRRSDGATQLVGDIGELIVTSSQLTTQQHTSLSQYTMLRYGIAA